MDYTTILHNKQKHYYNDGATNIQTFAKVLQTNTSLTILDVNYNNIGIEGAKHVSDALKINTTLTKLNMNRSDIGVEGAKHISDALKINTTLTRLNMNVNNIGVEGGKHINDALLNNYTLVNLNIYSNNIDKDTMETFYKLIKENRLKYAEYMPDKHQLYPTNIKKIIETIVRANNSSNLPYLPNEILFHIFSFIVCE